jgi:hypothetical protein
MTRGSHDRESFARVGELAQTRAGYVGHAWATAGER